MASWLQQGRLETEKALDRRGLAHTLSLAKYRLYQQIRAMILERARGDCLEVGSGRSPYRRILAEKVDLVTTLDAEDRTGRVDLLADIQDMPEVADASYDTVVCTQVLEHVPRPWDAMSEIARIIRADGCLILSAPHLSAIHEAPHDYYRYTRWGLEALARRAGLRVVREAPAGGLLSFLGHAVSYILLSTIGALPVLRWPVWAVNWLFLVGFLGLVDRLVGMPARYPCNLVLIAQRTGSAGRKHSTP